MDLQIVNMMELFVVMGRILFIKESVHVFDNAIYKMTMINKLFSSKWNFPVICGCCGVCSGCCCGCCCACSFGFSGNIQWIISFSSCVGGRSSIGNSRIFFYLMDLSFFKPFYLYYSLLTLYMNFLFSSLGSFGGILSSLQHPLPI
jgi:hypothetical protein